MESEHSSVRRGFRPVLALDPSAGGVRQFLISEEKIQVIALRGMGQAKDLAYSLREVLADPTAVFRGVREEGERDWLCYVGIPRHSYTSDGKTCPPRTGKVFLAFVNDERVVYHWRWEPCSQDDHTLPENYSSRFEERLK